MHVKSGRIREFVLIFISSLMVSVCCGTNPFTKSYLGIDSAVFSYVGKVILSGGMPYRDTFDHKGPLVYLINAFGEIINENAGVWIIELISIFTIFFFTYKIAQFLCHGYFSLFIVMMIAVLSFSTYFEGGNFVEEYACVFIMGSFYIYFRYFETEGVSTIKSYQVVLCGLSFGAICMLRVNMLSLWMVMCVGVLISCIKKKQTARLPRFILYFIMGFAIIVVPLLLWLYANNAFFDFINDYINFNIRYSSDGERASVKNVLKAIVFFATGAPVMLCVPIYIFVCIKENKFFDWISLIALICSILLSCISGQTYRHYGMSWYPLVIFSVIRIVGKYDVSEMFRSGRSKMAIILAGVSFGFLMFVPAIQEIATCLYRTVRPVNVITEESKIVSVIKENTDEKDAISVCGNWDVIYLLSGRKSSSRYSYQKPIADVDADIYDAYLADIKTLSARMVIITEMVVEDSEMYNDMIALLTDNYLLTERIGTNEVWVLK